MKYLSIQEVLRSIANSGLGFKSDGHVEFPQGGKFTVFEIPEQEDARTQMRTVLFHDEEAAAEAIQTFDELKEGWYYVAQFSDGRVEYRLCKDKSAALKRFRMIQTSFQKWEED